MHITSDFAIRELSVLAYAQGFTLWHYKAGAMPLATIAAPRFFDAARDMISAGDMILVSGVGYGGVLVCTSADAGVLTAPLAGDVSADPVLRAA